MKIRRTISSKGQVVIPKDIREYFGMKPGTKISFEVRQNELVIRPEVDPERFVEEFGSSVTKKLRKKIDLKRLYEEQYAEEYGLR